MEKCTHYKSFSPIPNEYKCYIKIINKNVKNTESESESERERERWQRVLEMRNREGTQCLVESDIRKHTEDPDEMQALGARISVPYDKGNRLRYCAEPELCSLCKTEHWEHVAHV